MADSVTSEGVDQFALLQFRVTVQVKFFGLLFQFFDRPFFVPRRRAPGSTHSTVHDFAAALEIRTTFGSNPLLS
ncbi:hypothetical protein BKP30_27600 [Rhodococcus erythropolis]|nr:hypothetical protein BKP30_27600 [Rhodococcus erythropolis]